MRRTGTMRLRRAALGSLILVLGLPMTAASASSGAPKPQVLRPALGPTTDIRLDVVSARDSTLRLPRGTDACAPFRGMKLLTPNTAPNASCANPAYTYKWIINEDNVGNPHQPSTANGIDAGDLAINASDVCRPLTASNPDGDPAFPANCNWPSVHPVLASPVVTQGDSSEWNLTAAMNSLPAGTTLAPHKYIVSVSADGYEIGGAHFTVPMTVAGAANSPGVITVGLNPYPIPLGTIQVKVFQDAAPADGTFDATTEHGLAGFSATINDILGQVSTDWYVNPICTEYERTVPERTRPESSFGRRHDPNGGPGLLRRRRRRGSAGDGVLRRRRS